MTRVASRFRGWTGRLLAVGLNRSSAYRLRKSRLVGPLIHWFSHRLLPVDTTVTTEIMSGAGRGMRLEINPRFGTGYILGDYEPLTQRVLMACLRPGDAFIDVGANIGFVSLLAAKAVGPTGRVVAIEPDPRNAASIRRNASLNDIDWIEVVEAAAWRRLGRLEFVPSGEHSVRLTGQVGGGREGNDKMAVDAVMLDQFNRLQPRFIKVDVEGGELDVLAGADQMFMSVRPVLLCEVHSDELEERVRAWLTGKSYDCELLGSEGHASLPQILARPTEASLPSFHFVN